MKASLPKMSLLYQKETFPKITNEPLMNQCHARRAMDGLTAIYKHPETRNYPDSITDTNSQLRLQITMKASLHKISLLYLKETFPNITNEPLMNQCHARRAIDGLTAIYKHPETRNYPESITDTSSQLRLQSPT